MFFGIASPEFENVLLVFKSSLTHSFLDCLSCLSHLSPYLGLWNISVEMRVYRIRRASQTIRKTNIWCLTILTYKILLIISTVDVTVQLSKIGKGSWYSYNSQRPSIPKDLSSSTAIPLPFLILCLFILQQCPCYRRFSAITIRNSSYLSFNQHVRTTHNKYILYHGAI